MNRVPEPKHIQGLSYPNDVSLSYGQLLGLVQASVPTSDAYYLLAESFSTPLAVQFAATKPPNLRGLILCAGFASSPVRGWRRPLMMLLAPLLFNLSVPKIGARLLVGSNASPTLLGSVRVAISAVQPKVLVARLKAVLACDATSELGQIEVPILYLLAKHDQIVPASCLEEIRLTKPTVTVAAIDGPHLLLQREPKQAAAAVTEFISKLDFPSFPLKTDN